MSIVTIAIAEDHALVREGLKLLFSMEPGFEVVAETGDGNAVEGLMRQHHPALLVLDLDLPGKTGVEVAAALSARRGADGEGPASAAGPKVLVLTGDLRPESVGRALAAGANGYVLKSEDTGELLAAVHAVLAGREYVSPRIAQAFRSGAAAGNAGREPAASLTPRERETLSLVARGFSNNDIAELLSISVLTVRTHRQKLMEKLELRNAAEITAYAVKHGIYDPS